MKWWSWVWCSDQLDACCRQVTLGMWNGSIWASCCGCFLTGLLTFFPMLPSTCCPLDLSFSCCPSLHPFLRILSLVVPSISMANEEMNISMNKKLLVLWILLVSLQQEQQWWHNFYTKHTRIPVQDKYVIENACFAIHKRYIIWPRGVRFWCTPQMHP